MPHPNVDARISAIAESQIMYRDMVPGEIITITAEDAKSGQQKSFQIRIVETRPVPGKNLVEATFEFWKGRFNFWLPNKAGTKAIKRGTLMESGLSAWWIPAFQLRLVGFGGIGQGRDYSFDDVSGQYQQIIIAHNISSIVSERPDKPIRNLPSTSKHLAAIKKTLTEFEAMVDSSLPEAIVLSDDPILKGKLTRKLAEYRQRLETNQRPGRQSGTYCKIEVLTRLLQDERIAPVLLREQFKDQPWFTAEDFRNACGVISDYCSSGGKNTCGGTGLK